MSWGGVSNKAAINWQNIAQVQLELKFTLMIPAQVVWLIPHGPFLVFGKDAEKLRIKVWIRG